MTGQAVEVTGVEVIDRAVKRWSATDLLPAQFKDQQGHAKMADLQLAASWLNDVEVPPGPNLPQVYVVKGRVGLMAELQRALLQRAGFDIEVIHSTASEATVRVWKPTIGQWSTPVTVTFEQAEKAGWTARKRADAPSMYELMPDRMLLARACTKAVSLHAPGALRGIVAPALGRAGLIDDEDGAAAGQAATGEVPPVPAAAPSPFASAPDGSTIPTALREEAIDSEERTRLLALLAALQTDHPEPFARLTEYCRFLRMPNLRSHRVTRVHGALLARLIDEVVEDVPSPSSMPQPGERAGREDAGTASNVPASTAAQRDPATLTSEAARPAPDDRPPASVYDHEAEAYGPDEEPF